MSVLVGKPAPDFSQPALLGDGSITTLSLATACSGSACVLFFYPHNFESHCGVDLRALGQHLEALRRRHTVLVSVSVDSIQAHRAWCDQSVEAGGLGRLAHPMVSDPLHEVSRDYDVLAADGTSLKSVFVIDAVGIVRFQSVSELATPLDVSYLLELLDSIGGEQASLEV